MANVTRDEYWVLTQKGDLDVESADLRVAAMDPTYTYSSGHDRYDDISAAVLGTPVQLSNVSVLSDGMVDADNSTFTDIDASEQIESLWIYRHNATASLAELLHFIDTGTGFSGDGSPITTDGNNVLVTWPAGGIWGPA